MILLPPNVSRDTHRQLGSGCECYVYEWVPRQWVLKAYRTKDHARHAYEQQEKAAQHGLAPAVDEQAQVFPVWVERTVYEKNVGSSPKKYGYLSQWVQCEGGTMYTSPGNSEVRDLIDQLQEHECLCGDMHGGNMGRLPDGTLVRIDFGGAGEYA